jgi:3-hydroxyisobutyrate dehydrogenase
MLQGYKVSFIGLGAMGSHMAANLVKAGCSVTVHDAYSPSASRFVASHPAARVAESASAAAGVSGTRAVITMLPSSPHVREVYEGGGGGGGGVVAAAPAGALLIDCSTVSPEASRAVSAAAAARGLQFLDAPVSGGVGGAAAGTLTFMAGGSAGAFAAAQPLLRAMGAAVTHVGAPGAGSAAKLCNNLVLGASMLAVAEAFALARKLGVEPAKLHAIINASSGRCWASEVYSPVPGLVPAAPAGRDYEGGFALALMIKDLHLALDAARGADSALPATAAAATAYALAAAALGEKKDFSAVFQLLNASKKSPPELK